MGMENSGAHRDRELYALLHLDPDASEEDIRRAYRHWAQVYHPDKHRTIQMQDIATQNFQRIREAYEILVDERKRQIYDIYGMEGLRSGLELGPKLKSREEIREEFERFQARKAEQKLASHVHHSGSMLVNLSLVDAMRSSLRKPPIFTGMAMTTQIQAQLSRKDTALAGGSMYLRKGMGGGTVTGVIRHQIDPATSVEVLAMAGIRSVLNCQVSQQISSHLSATLSLSYSPRDGSVTLGESWTRQIAENTTGTIQLLLGGPQPGVSASWQHHGRLNAISSDIKVGPGAVGLSAQASRQFSAKSKGKISGKIGSTGIEMELGGERSVSDHSTAGMFCVIGLQGVSWKLRFTRGGQKFVVPILLATPFHPVVALGALVIPSSLYMVLKTYVFKPYFLKRSERKKLEQLRVNIGEITESREAAEKAQELLKLVAERKRSKAEQQGGVIITKAIYGNLKAQDQPASTRDKDLPPPFIDVTIVIQYLIDDNGELKLYGGVKKSGLMGFCDPNPNEPSQLFVAYTIDGCPHEIIVNDFDEMIISQAAHRAAAFSRASITGEPGREC